MDYVTLNNGNQMPLLGTGTNTYGKVDNNYQGELNNDFSALESAIEVGYRLIDTAISYRNEAGVGRTCSNNTVPREEFFLTTKIPIADQYVGDADAVRRTIDQSLENFETDYLDLYLIHHPLKDKEQVKMVWEVLEEYVKAGKLKNIGVSNFTKAMIEDIKDHAEIMPAVNQIQINMKEKNKDLIEYLKEENITPMAWGPMGATDEQKEELDRIGENYGKEWSQTLLRYQIQQGIVVIPKSHNPENQKLNLDIFNFDLTKEDLLRIDDL